MVVTVLVSILTLLIGVFLGVLISKEEDYYDEEESEQDEEEW